MNIYCGNLPYDVNDDELREMFAAHGEVSSAKVIQDKFTGRSKGFGFVEMPNDNEGRSALSAFNGKEYKGRELRVDEARPQRDFSK